MHTNISPALGFQSSDRFNKDVDMKSLCSIAFSAGPMLTTCTDIHRTNMGTDTGDLLDDSIPFSCLDMLSINTDSKRPHGTSGVAVADLKSTVLVEDTLMKYEHMKYESCDNYSHFEEMSIQDVLAFMMHTAEVPSIDNFVYIVQRCRKTLSFVHAFQVHLHLCNHGLEAHEVVGNFLVPMFVECRRMDIVHQVFSRLSYRNEHSWTSLMQGYIASEELEQALNLYQMMLYDFVEPSNYTFVALLRACAHVNDVERGQFYHSEIVKKGKEQHSFVGSALMDMYTKCGSLADARQTLDKMLIQDVVLWTSMISGYAEHGFGEEALVCMEEIGKNGLSPDAFTMACCLKACADIGAIEEGHKLHTELVKMGFHDDDFAGIAVMDMYAKCGALLEVKQVFEALPVRDNVTWTTLVAAYGEHEYSQEALNCLEPMQLEGVSPAAATFVCILKACASTNDIENGRFLQSEIVKRGLEQDNLVGNTLIDMYAKCGSLAEAQEVLSMLPNQGAVPWTALIVGYLVQGDAEQVYNCFEQVGIKGVPVDEALFVCCLKACGGLGVLDKGQERHIDAVKIGFEKDTFVGNTLVGMYAKCGALYEANELFLKLPVRNIVSWNALLAGYSDFGPFDKAWKCFCQMQSEGVVLDGVTCACILKACGSVGAIDKGQEVHCELAKKGYETDLMVANTLVDMYGKCGSIVEAQSMFDILVIKDLASWNALLQAYTVQKLDEEALSCFQQMQLNGVCLDVISWNIMILCYAEQREKDQACLFYARMLEQGVLANGVVFVNVLKACGDLASIETVRRVHGQVYNAGGYESIDVTMTTTLIDIYSKCGSMYDAQQLFDALPARVFVTWSALITGYARQGNSGIVFHLFLEMAQKGIQPDEVIFLGIISVCSHEGLLYQGQKYFEIMCECYGIMPHLEHYTCMVDLFGRGGHLDMVVKLVEELPVEPDSVMWRTVMDACSRWGDTNFGRMAFKQASLLDKKHDGLYISLANLYADVGVGEDYIQGG